MTSSEGSGGPLSSQDRCWSSNPPRPCRESECGPLMAYLSAQLSDVHVQVSDEGEIPCQPFERQAGSMKGDSCREATPSEGQLSELQDRLEVSYQWALDLEADLKYTKARAEEASNRCQLLESALREKDQALHSTLPSPLTQRILAANTRARGERSVPHGHNAPTQAASS
jgi:hypothetical protein